MYMLCVWENISLLAQLFEARTRTFTAITYELIYEFYNNTPYWKYWYKAAWLRMEE